MLAAAALALIALPAQAAEQRFARTIPLPPGTPIRIEATIADLLVEGTAGTDLHVEIVRRAPSDADLARYPVLVDERGGAVSLTTVQAGGGVDPALRTEIRVSVPAGAILDRLRVVEGRVRLANLHGTCDAAIRRGNIEAADISGRVRLEAELGRIDLRDAALTAGGLMHLRTFNGNVRVRFPRAPSDGRILAVTYNGAITSDIPLAMKDRFGPRFGETTLGRGEPVLSIDVVKGDVAIKVQ